MLFSIFTIVTLMAMSILFLFMSHPLALGLTLLFQVLLSALNVGIYSMSTWFAYILFLVFIGGVLVLFLYVTSLANNEVLKVSPLWFSLTAFFNLMMTMILYLTQTLSIYYPLDCYNNQMKLYSIKTISTLYDIPLNWSVLFLAYYMFLALTVIAKIVDTSSGALRSN